MKSRCLLLCVFLLKLLQGVASAEVYKFRTMSPDGGFYYDGVKAIEQDKEGFLWVMMDYELYRFDGYHYKSIILILPQWLQQRDGYLIIWHLTLWGTCM